MREMMKHLDAPNPGCTPKHDINCPQIWLVDWNLVPVSTKTFPGTCCT